MLKKLNKKDGIEALSVKGASQSYKSFFKNFLFLFIFIFLISFASASPFGVQVTPLETYSISQTGFEKNYNVSLNPYNEKVDLDHWWEDLLELIGIGKDEKVDELFYKVEICSDFESKEVLVEDKLSSVSVPDKLSVKSYLGSVEKEIDRELIKSNELSLTPDDFEVGDKYCFYDVLNPREDYYKKYGDNSIVITLDTTEWNTAYVNQTKQEQNFTHLEINSSGDYYGYFGSSNNYMDSGFKGETLIAGIVNGSISVWFRDSTTGAGAYEYLLGQDDGIPSISLRMHANNYTTFYFGDNDTAGDCGINTQTTKNLRDGEWHNVVFIRGYGTGGSAHALFLDGYINGTEWYQAACNGNITLGRNILFGTYGDGATPDATYEYNGDLDEFIWFDTNLNASDVLQIYNHGRLTKYNGSRSENITHYFSFGDEMNDVYDEYTNVEASYYNGATTKAYAIENYTFQSLVAYYPFDGDFNNTIAFDWANADNDGTYQGNAVSNSTNAIYGDALHLDGNGDYINTGKSFVLTDNFSLSYWMRFDNYIDYANVLSTATDGNCYNGWWTEFGHGRGFTMYGDDYASANNVSLILSDNVIDLKALRNETWYYVTIVRDGYGANNVKGYINNTLFGQNKFNGIIGENVENLLIGKYDNTATVNYFNGSIDEVMIFDRALNATEITAIYTNQSSRFYDSGTTLLSQTNVTGTINKINVSVDLYQTLLGSNLSARGGWWNETIGNFTYGDYVNLTDGEATLDVNNASNYTIDFKLWGGNNLFYSPLIGGNVLLTYFFISPDTQAPAINITYPLNETNTTNNQIDVNYTLTEETGLDNCWWTEDNGITNNSITCGDNVTGETWNEGYNNVSVFAKDTGANINQSIVTFFVDSIDPIINFSTPTTPSGTYEGQTYILINVTASDANLDNITIFLTNLTAVVNRTNSSVSPYFMNFSDLPYADYFFWVHAYDVLDNYATTEARAVTLTADATNPALTVLNPTNTTYYSTNINLQGTCTDNSAVDKIFYSLDGASNISFTFNITLSTTGYEVYHNLSVYCNDTVNNLDFEHIRFYVGTNATSGIDTNATTECADGYVLLGNGSCGVYGSTYNETYQQYAYNQTYTPSTGSCKLTKKVSDGYFPYGKLGCAINFV